MKTIKLVSIFIILISIFASSCEKNKDKDELVTFNESNHKIKVAISFNYPDTTLSNIGGCIGCFSDIIEPNSSYQHFYYPNSKYGWRNHISERNPQNTITMFVIHGDTLTNYTFEEIQEDYNILRRYELNINELEAMNWTIIYP